ncbi:cytochrome c3 family protein [Ferrimonas sp. YFM]|uniref:cytochrome c3 family protein n=1 Tax=Ferrimonas sp. YFM TaxID=3028878 RepID=UPI0025734972|nr:cytochrome c3 family protein [Ferrimonas sp. YFM]
MKPRLMLLAACLAWPLAAQPLADMHSEMSGCESCHADGVPSSDLVHENQACTQCHGTLAELEGETHQAHQGNLECADCHQVHEDTDASDSCDNCHQ